MATKICARIWREPCFVRRLSNSTEVMCRDSGNRCAASRAGVSLTAMLVPDRPGCIEDTLLRHTQGAEVGLPRRAVR
jgi:hypothetical protein